MSAYDIPKMHDLVAITIKQVEYYGYVDDIDYDVRSLMACIEFAPSHREWFDLSEIKRVEYPEEKK